MKKIAFILAVAIMCTSFAACGGSGSKPEPTVAPTKVPYNEGDVVVTVGDEYTIDTFGIPQFPITIENKGDYTYRITTDKISINGKDSVKDKGKKIPLGEEGCLNVDVNPGEIINDNVNFMVYTWDLLGIDKDDVKEIEISFTINDVAGYKNFTKVVKKEYK